MRIAYFDCFSGISGDMCLGALVDAGVSIKELKKELEKISVRGYRLSARNVMRTNFKATKVDVSQPSTISPRSSDIRRWKDIEKIIQKSSLSNNIKQRGLNIFKRIFESEAKVHGEPFHKVHLHEVGSVDTIIDVLGTIIGLNILSIEEIYASPINVGRGFIKTNAEVLPVPAPATAEILKKVPVYSKNILSELTTPTGAAIIKELSSGFGDMPLMNIERIGVGAGTRNFKESPNVLRIFYGNKITVKKGEEKITVIETNIDDMNPQIYEYIMEKLLKSGALDVYLTQVIMKKGRPGVELTVLSNEGQKEDLIEIILRETSTIGLRFYEAERRVLHRDIKTVDTKFGKVRVKISRLKDNVLKKMPEYEDCKKIAKRLNIPLIEIIKKLNL
jgi:uncharacterized protein (TIGR00299 family) protein